MAGEVGAHDGDRQHALDECVGGGAARQRHIVRHTEVRPCRMEARPALGVASHGLYDAAPLVAAPQGGWDVDG